MQNEEGFFAGMFIEDIFAPGHCFSVKEFVSQKAQG
jgi:hypothetical protein